MSTLGHFQKDGREYVFTTYETRRPMLNYSWNERFLSAFNQLLTGHGLYCDKATITASYVDLRGRVKLINDGNRYFYLRDDESGDYWNPGFYPANKRLDAYACTMGLGYAKYHSSRQEIEADARVFVNESDPTEIWTFRIKNKSNRGRRIKLYPLVEWSLEGYDARSDYFSYLYAEYDEAHHTILAYNPADERPHERYNGFMAVSRRPSGFDSSLTGFLGTYGTYSLPRAVIEGRCANTIASCERLAGAFEITFALAPGAEERVDVLIGSTDTKAEALRMVKKLFAPGAIDADFENLLARKEEMVNRLYIETPDERINNIFNTWTKQQVFLCSEVGRGNHRGYRDVLQDAWGNVPFNAADAKRKILEALAHQYSDGHAPRGWMPLDERYYSDSPVWIPMAVNEYLKETGDFGLLDVIRPFLDGGEGTVLEHCLRAMRHLFKDVGLHGLVLAHLGDWNDSLTGMGAAGKGETAWTSIAFHLSLLEMERITREILHREDLAAEMRSMAEHVRRVVNAVAWDGEWYIEGYTDDGHKVGTHTEKEGRIYLNPQSWAVISRIAPPDRIEKAFKAVDTLLEAPYGMLTLWPAYTKENKKIGRLTAFVPGVWENGTPYCHGGAFKIVADCILGRGDKAYETLAKIIPDSKENPVENSGCEPYAFTNMYQGPDNPRPGFAMFGWITGSAGWMYRAMTQWIMGFHCDYDSVVIDPCLPAAWKSCRIRRKFRENTYDIKISNPDGVQKGLKRLIVDGKEIEGNRIAYVPDGKVHEVTAVMG